MSDGAAAHREGPSSNRRRDVSHPGDQNAEVDEVTPRRSDTLGQTFPWDPLRYPFDVPSHSFTWSAGQVDHIPSFRRLEKLSAGRHPILAIGSNASPAQLTRKFADARFTDSLSPEGSIPVLTAEVDDVDVVYGAHLAWYGSLPATLLDTAGARAQVFITWLTDLQLERMNETEGLGHAYQLRRTPGVCCHGDQVDSALSYVTVGGACLLGGDPLGLTAISAPGSRRPRATQQQAWDQLALDMHCDVDGAALVGRVLVADDWRERVEIHLAANRLPERHGPVEL
jgi:hypothetical protein